MKRLLIVASALLLAAQANAWTDPQNRPDNGGTLRAAPTGGNSAGYVAPAAVKRVVLQLLGTNSREWERFGFKDDEVKHAITEKLKRAGIEVVDAKTSGPDVFLLEVDVHVNDQTVNNSYINFVRLKNRLPLPNNPEGFVTRTVWSEWKIGGFEPYNYRKLRGAVLDIVDLFIREYGNPS
ncbi:MAG: hypothetical protein U1F34_04390 [Gammaproteobacteria bacterium]